jgi:hypothetical protein
VIVATAVSWVTTWSLYTAGMAGKNNKFYFCEGPLREFVHMRMCPSEVRLLVTFIILNQSSPNFEHFLTVSSLAV